jgi:glycine/D-amino acid oxidase-like deaminating enzyme
MGQRRIGADVVGGGIAGISAAAFAAAGGASVTLVEREQAMSVHTTGRSAALYLANYGRAQTRRLTFTSRDFLDDPPEGFTNGPLLAPCGVVWVGSAGDAGLLHEVAQAGLALDPTITEITGEQVRELCPVLRPEHAAAGVLEPNAAELDVAALHAGFVRMLRGGGGTVLRGNQVTALSRTRTGWTVTTTGTTLTCDRLVDAAGAWGDEVAALARGTGGRAARAAAHRDEGGSPGGSGHPRVALGQPCAQHLVLQAGGRRAPGLASRRDTKPAVRRQAGRARRGPGPGAGRAGHDAADAIGSVHLGRAPHVRPRRRAGHRAGPRAQVVCLVRGPGWGYGIQSAAAAGRLTADLALGLDPRWAGQAGIDTAALGPGRLRAEQHK